MLTSFRLQALVLVVLGSGLGYLAGSGALNSSPDLRAEDVAREDVATDFTAPAAQRGPACCAHDRNEDVLLAQADIEIAQAPKKAAPAGGKKPNIVFIMGDDIGWFNIGAYHQGIMSGKTPNLDKLASA
jgi:arylsulfatase